MPMEFAPENLTSTPAEFATPSQIKQAQEYAHFLRQGGGQQPVKHWTQGVANMVSALVGGYESARAGQNERNALSNSADKDVKVYNPESSNGQWAGTDDPYINRTVHLESGGDPKNVTGSNRGLAQYNREDEKRLGITDWTNPEQHVAALRKERAENRTRLASALGRDPTPGEEYLTHQQGAAGGPTLLTSDPRMPAWQAIRKYYPNEKVALSAVAGNIPSDSPLKGRDPRTITVGEFRNMWTNKFERGMRPGAPQAAPVAPANGPAMAFNGNPADLPGGAPNPANAALSAAGSPEQMAAVLAPKGPAAVSPPGPAGPPPISRGVVGPSGQGSVPQGVIPNRPKISPELYFQIMRDPWRPQAEKDYYRGLYLQQNQPQESMDAAGNKVIIGRDGTQHTIYGVHDNKLRAGDSETTSREIFDIDPATGFPRVRQAPIVGAPGGGSAPAAPIGGAAGGSREAPPPSLNDIPGMMNGTGKRSEAEPEAGPTGDGKVRFAALGNTATDTMPEEASKPSGMLTAGPPPPPVTKDEVATKVAQAAGGSYTGTGNPQLDAMAAASDNRAVSKAAREAYNTGDIKEFNDRYKARITSGEQAAMSLPQIQLAQKAIEDQNFYSGIGADAVIDWKRIQAQLSNNPNASAANELFDKIISGNIVQDMKVSLQGLGQVRVAEINLLAKAAANRYNSVPANRAVLRLMERTHQQANIMSDAAIAYRQGWRYDKDGNPYKTNELPTAAGYDEMQKKVLAKIPALSPQEILEYEKLFSKEGYDKKRAAGIEQDLIGAAKNKQPEGASNTAPTMDQLEAEKKRRGL